MQAEIALLFIPGCNYLRISFHFFHDIDPYLHLSSALVRSDRYGVMMTLSLVGYLTRSISPPIPIVRSIDWIGRALFC